MFPSDESNRLSSIGLEQADHLPSKALCEMSDTLIRRFFSKIVVGGIRSPFSVHGESSKDRHPEVRRGISMVDNCSCSRDPSEYLGMTQT